MKLLNLAILTILALPYLYLAFLLVKKAEIPGKLWGLVILELAAGAIWIMAGASG